MFLDECSGRNAGYGVVGGVRGGVRGVTHQRLREIARRRRRRAGADVRVARRRERRRPVPFCVECASEFRDALGARRPHRARPGVRVEIGHFDILRREVTRQPETSARVERRCSGERLGRRGAQTLVTRTQCFDVEIAPLRVVRDRLCRIVVPIIFAVDDVRPAPVHDARTVRTDLGESRIVPPGDLHLIVRQAHRVEPRDSFRHARKEARLTGPFVEIHQLRDVHIRRVRGERFGFIRARRNRAQRLRIMLQPPPCLRRGLLRGDENVHGAPNSGQSALVAQGLVYHQ